MDVFQYDAWMKLRFEAERKVRVWVGEQSRVVHGEYVRVPALLFLAVDALLEDSLEHKMVGERWAEVYGKEHPGGPHV